MSGTAIGHEERKGLRDLWTRSLQDLIAIYLPYMIMAADMIILMCYVYDPAMNFLLYASLPDRFRNWFTFGLCMVEEVRLFIILGGTKVPVWQLQVTAFDLVNNSLEHMEQHLLQQQR